MRFTLLLILFFSTTAKCQSDTSEIEASRNIVSVEFIGHSRTLLSANYERLIKPYNSNINFSARAGIGYTPGSHEDLTNPINSFTTIPLVISMLAGKKKHFAQLGVGYTAAFGKDGVDSTTRPPTISQKFESAFIMSLGYRYMGKGIIIQGFPLLQWTNNPGTHSAVLFGFAIGCYL